MSEFEELQAAFESVGLSVAAGLRCVTLLRLHQSHWELLALPPNLLVSVFMFRVCERIWVKPAAQSSAVCLAKTSASAGRADGQRLALVRAEPVVLVRFLFSLPLELLKTLYQCHKLLHEYRCDDWCCLMSILIKSYNCNVEMGPKVFSKEGETALYFL